MILVSVFQIKVLPIFILSDIFKPHLQRTLRVTKKGGLVCLHLRVPWHDHVHVHVLVKTHHGMQYIAEYTMNLRMSLFSKINPVYIIRIPLKS